MSVHLLRKQPDGALTAFAHLSCTGSFAHIVQGAEDFVKSQVLARLKKSRHDSSDNCVDSLEGGTIVHMTSIRNG